MIKREKNRKLHGSVLLTVVCVMSLLIVFLFGTLALATAANNRAHVNYSTAQTEVTSRTVVDAAIKAMVASPDYANAVSQINTSGINHLDVRVQLGDNVPDVGKYGDISNVSIDLAGKKKFYDSDKKEWIDGDILRFTSTVSMAGVDSTTSAYIVKQPPEINNGNGGGAGYVTTSGTSIDCSTFLAGGAYINLPELGFDKNDNKIVESDDTKGAVFYDYRYRTDEEYKSWESDPTIYRQFAPYGAEGGTTFKFSNTPSGAETDLYVINNVDMFKCDNIVFPGESKGITIWGDMVFSQDTQNANYIFKNIKTENIAFNKMPYIYVDGAIKCTANQNSIVLGDTSSTSESSPLNIFCGNIVLNGNNNVKINGDIYCMNPNKTSIIKPANNTALYSWTGSVINKTGETGKEHKSSSIYSKGNLELGNMTIDGDVRVEKDCIINGNVTINGDLVIGGNLTVNSGTLKLGKNNKVYYDGDTSSLNTNVSKDKKYKEVPTILRDISALDLCDHSAEKINNDQRYYMEAQTRFMSPEEEGYDSEKPYVGLLGEKFESDMKLYYKWKENFSPAETWGAGVTKEFYTNSSNYAGMNIADFIEGEPYTANFDGSDDKRPHNSADNSTEYYYTETSWNAGYNGGLGGYISNSKETNETSYYANKITHERITECRIVPDFDGNPALDSEGKEVFMLDWVYDLGTAMDYSEYSNSVWYNVDTKKRVSMAEAATEAGGFVTSPVADAGYIYPEHAERDVILGLKTITGKTKDSTQIVKTIAEVLETVANPYKDGQLSVQMSQQYKELYKKYEAADKKDSIYFTNVQEILKANQKYATNVKTDGSYETKTPVLTGDNNNDTFSGGYNSPGGVPEGAIITNDCILELNTSLTKCKYLIFEPGTKDILVVIKNLNFDNIPIMVNDSEGGSVNFYIENDSSMTMSSEDWIAPTSYLKAFAEDKTGSLKYSSSSATSGINLNDLGRPKINIYGEPNSKFIQNNFQFIIANIISSDLFVDISSTNGVPSWAKFNNIHYNDVDINSINKKEQFVIGCINSNYTKIPNQLNVIYVTDADSDDKDPIGDGENAFNYRILYYDEY